MTLRCLNCGHEWDSRAKRPQCPKCKKYRVENSSKLNDVNDELKNVDSSESIDDMDEPVDETKPDEDIIKDVHGEIIIEEKPKKAKKKINETKGFNWELTNIALTIGAIAAVGLALWFWLFNRDVPEDKKEQKGLSISDAWAETLGLR